MVFDVYFTFLLKSHTYPKKKKCSPGIYPEIFLNLWLKYLNKFKKKYISLQVSKTTLGNPVWIINQKRALKRKMFLIKAFKGRTGVRVIYRQGLWSLLSILNRANNVAARPMFHFHLSTFIHKDPQLCPFDVAHRPFFLCIMNNLIFFFFCYQNIPDVILWAKFLHLIFGMRDNFEYHSKTLIKTILSSNMFLQKFLWFCSFVFKFCSVPPSPS